MLILPRLIFLLQLLQTEIQSLTQKIVCTALIAAIFFANHPNYFIEISIFVIHDIIKLQYRSASIQLVEILGYRLITLNLTRIKDTKTDDSIDHYVLSRESPLNFQNSIFIALVRGQHY